MKVKLTTLFLFIILSTAPLFSQINIGGKPHSFILPTRTSIPSVQIQPLDLKKLLAEDEIEMQYKDIPYRFGTPIDVNYDLQNSGVWQTMPNGDRLWLLQISAPNAFSINLNYSRFHLPKGALLYIYSTDKKYTIGGFTENNNNTDQTFASGILPGSSCILEYYEPAGAINQGQINISQVVYGYRDVFAKVRNYGNSGSCNNNINCGLASNWQKEKRAVAMILTSNNTRFCTGVMLNNVRQDTTPFLLTAKHCYDTGVNSWIFMFNYESSLCTNEDGPTNQTLQGAIIRAMDTPSDFLLLQLTNTPPANYHVYYAGWSNLDVTGDSSVCIHHPNGDIKKITFDYGSTTSTDWVGPIDSHWNIASWESGTTERGSSGSPLFNKQHLVIGQLHGGDATCDNNVNDNYGKFAYSWQTNADTSKQLKHWLNPDNIVATSLQGNDFFPLAIKEKEIQKEIQIFPNPTTREIIITNPTKEKQVIEIYNTMGMLIFMQESNNNANIDLSQQDGGIYVVRISTNNEQTVSKLILSK